MEMQLLQVRVPARRLEAARVVMEIDEEYPEMTFDLAGFAKGTDFVNFLSRMGSKVVYVPTEAHWKSRAENLVHRFRVELAAVFHEFPSLSCPSASKAALKRINGRILSKFGISRREIHKGRPSGENDFKEILLSAPYPLTPPWIQLDKRREAAAFKVEDVDKARVRDRVRRAIKSKRCKATDMCHGDDFLFWREEGKPKGGKSKGSRGWQGSAVCIGISGAVVIGWYSGQVITVHITRCIVTKRHPDGENVFIQPSELRVPRPVAKEDLMEPLSDIDVDFLAEEDNFGGSTLDENEDWSSNFGLEIPSGEPVFEEDNGFRADALPASDNSWADELNPVIAPLSREVFDFPLNESLGHFNKHVDQDPEDLALPLLEVENGGQNFLPSFDSKVQNESRENDFHRLTLKKRLREVAEASRNGQKYPKEEKDDSAPEDKRRRCHTVKREKRWDDDERDFNQVFSCDYGTKIPLELGADTCYYYQPTNQGPVVRRCYLANKSKQRTIVLDFEEASADPLMKTAMENEIQSFRNNNCVEEVELDSLEDQANKVSTRWVLTLKTNEDGTRKCKARLVARCFEDMEKDIITRDSPVASNASQRLVVQACVESQFRIHSWDFQTAFLQGKLMSRDNSVYIMPPKDFDVPAGKVWKLLRPVYGLFSAPKAWYDRLLEVMEKCGIDSKLTDEGVLRMVGKAGDVVGILALHVDDTIGGGTQEFHDAMNLVGQSLEVGAKEKDAFHYNGFVYKGLRATTAWENENRGRTST